MSHGTHSVGRPIEQPLWILHDQNPHSALSLTPILYLSLSGCANQSIAMPGVGQWQLAWRFGKTNNGNNYVRFIMQQQQQQHLHHHHLYYAHHHHSRCWRQHVAIVLKLFSTLLWLSGIWPLSLSLFLCIPLCCWPGGPCHCDVWQRFDSSNSNLVYDSYAKRITERTHRQTRLGY